MRFAYAVSVSQPNALTQLAAEMVPCPASDTWRDSNGRHVTFDGRCQVCGGSGLAPRIPGLRVPCWVNPDSGDHQYAETEHDDDLGIHPAEGCPGYTVLSGAEALLVLEEWTRRNGYSVQVLANDPASSDCFVIVEDSDAKEFYGRGTDVLEAAVNTLTKALGLAVRAPEAQNQRLGPR